VDSLKQIDDDSVELAFHIIDGKEGEAKKLKFRYKDGNLTLAPKCGMSILRSYLRLASGTTFDRRFTPSVSTAKDSTSLGLIGRSATIVTENGIARDFATMEVKSFNLGERVPFEEFRLSAFGLPEPGKALVDQRGRSWWWIGSGGLVIVLAGLWVYRRQRAA
jgi:hypothetical protein